MGAARPAIRQHHISYKVHRVPTKSGGTHHISVSAATNALYAARFAADTGRAFTLLVTINWHRLSIDDACALRAWRSLRDSVMRHWRYLRSVRGPSVGQLVGVASQENPGGRRNTHWLVAVPDRWAPEFRRIVQKNLAKVAGVPQLGASLVIEPLYAVGGAMKYALKGVDPAYQGYFNITAKDQGFIAGKGRTSVSRSLSYTARRRAGWVRQRRSPI